MERYILTLLAIVMCLLESKTQAMNPNYDGSTSTITLDKGEYLYQQVEKTITMLISSILIMTTSISL